MNRIVFITGATSGIGEACAEKFAENGDALIINGRRKDRLDDIKKLLEKKYKINVLCAPFDVKNRNEVFESIASFSKEWEPIDILINNAGLALGRDYFDEADIDDWDTMMQTNVNGMLYVSKAVLPAMVKRNQGHIINLGSVAGDDMYEKGNAYCVSKTAVNAISKTMRIDLLQHNIKVTNVKPGAADTEFSIVRFKGDAETASKVYDGYTPLSGKDIADAIFYCASLPANVCINELVITATAQANGIFFNRK
ncbi:MAG: SDR family NAD(P)-dependent oxidoreductase [Bacteroidota bacterium]|nr:SDR family NAD(P)-dependent oxidoreductase [Bacteroidota bacterium]